MKLSFLMIILCCLCCNIHMAADNMHASRHKQNPAANAGVKEFPKITIPQIIAGPQEKVTYLLQHYWDKFDFSDLDYLKHPEVLDRAVINYIQIFSMIGHPELVKPEIYNTLKKTEAAKPMTDYFVDLFTTYLSGPNSPARNEDYYLQVLSFIIESKQSSTADIENAKYKKRILLKNRTGHKAADIVYTSADGKSNTLYNIKSDFTVLLFYNPDCNACSETIDLLKNSAVINKALIEKRLAILAVYPDEDLEIWKKHFDEIPASWINAYDHGGIIEKKQLYDLQAIPTLYLLDSDKKVVLKDIDASQIINFLKSH